MSHAIDPLWDRIESSLDRKEKHKKIMKTFLFLGVIGLLSVPVLHQKEAPSIDTQDEAWAFLLDETEHPLDGILEP